jgi:hypothetical protein
MSKRALKRVISALLFTRDRLCTLIRHYQAVLEDLESADARVALRTRVQELESARTFVQAEAERLAAGLPSRKTTYAGRWLHDRGQLL